MKNKKIGLFLLLLSFLLLFFGYKEYNKHRKWNKEFKKLQQEYLAENYQYSFDNGDIEKFIKGNSQVKLLENTESKDSAVKKLSQVLEFYKERLKEKDDVNIKKNYEIVKKRLEDEKKKNPQDKNQNQNQNQNQNKNQDQNQNSGGGDQEKDKDKNKGDQEKDQNKGNGDQEKEDQGNKGNGDKEEDKKGNNGEGENKEENKGKQQELQYILKKLEDKEGQAFKNNERVNNKMEESKDDRDKW